MELSLYNMNFIKERDAEITRLTKQRYVAALHWIASQPASGAIQCRALEAIASVKGGAE
jgi:hypothetical protein